MERETSISTLLVVLLGGVVVAVLNRPRRVDLEEAGGYFFVLSIRKQPRSSNLMGIGAVLLVCAVWLLCGLEAMVQVIMLSSFLEAWEVSVMERRLGKPVMGTGARNLKNR
jgi:hypothetical protein